MTALRRNNTNTHFMKQRERILCLHEDSTELELNVLFSRNVYLQNFRFMQRLNPLLKNTQPLLLHRRPVINMYVVGLRCGNS